MNAKKNAKKKAAIVNTKGRTTPGTSGSGRDEVDSRRVNREAPGPHFERVAKMWSALCGHYISAEMVVLMMTALKLAREAGGHEPDNMLDAEGYASLHKEVREYSMPSLDACNSIG